MHELFCQPKQQIRLPCKARAEETFPTVNKNQFAVDAECTMSLWPFLLFNIIGILDYYFYIVGGLASLPLMKPVKNQRTSRHYKGGSIDLSVFIQKTEKPMILNF